MITSEPHSQPVPFEEVEDVAAAVLHGLDTEDLADVALVAVAPRDDGNLTVVLIDHREPDPTATLDALTAGTHRVLALASRVRWAPNDDEPSRPAWLALVVGRGQPVVAAVRRHQDRRWQRVVSDQLPWFALSSTAALRRALDADTPLNLKQANDRRLYRRVDEGEPPPVDEQGNL